MGIAAGRAVAALRRRPWLAALVLVGAAAIALSIAAGLLGPPLDGDVRGAQEVQRSSWFGGVAPVLNAAGEYHWVYYGALLAGTLAWLVAQRRIVPGAGAAWPLSVALTGVLLDLDQLLKALIQAPRPAATDGIAVRETATNFGFPSGHVYGDLLLLGLAAWWTLRGRARPVRWAGWAVVATVVCAVGAARVYSGAHWPSDVLGGALWGTLALSAAIGGSHALAHVLGARGIALVPEPDPAPGRPG
jgi:undecaprenyl-diphosphatase